MSTFSNKPKQKKPEHYLLPAMGLIIAVAVAVIAYLLAPITIDLIRNQMGEARFDARLGSFSEQNLQIAFTVVIWLVLFALSMMLVSALIGVDPNSEDQLVRPRENASEKEWAKYEKRLAKIRKRRQKRADQLERQQERNRKG
jgi:hypothetical protein